MLEPIPATTGQQLPLGKRQWKSWTGRMKDNKKRQDAQVQDTGLSIDPIRIVFHTKHVSILTIVEETANPPRNDTLSN